MKFKVLLVALILLAGSVFAQSPIEGLSSELVPEQNGKKLIGLFGGNFTMYNTNGFEDMLRGGIGYSINTKMEGFLGALVPHETFAVIDYGKFDQSADTLTISTNVYEFGAIGLYYLGTNSETLKPFFLLGGLLETLDPTVEVEGIETAVEEYEFRFSGDLGLGTFYKFKNSNAGLFGAAILKFKDDLVFSPLLGLYITL
jgi:hypothetical protein